MKLKLIMEESEAGKQAKAMGLDYMSFGRYGKGGKQTHGVKNGKLVPIKKPEGKPKLAIGQRAKHPNLFNTDDFAHGRDSSKLTKQAPQVYGGFPDQELFDDEPTTGKDFSSTTDTWFDELSDTIGSIGGKPAETLRALAEKPPTASTLQQIKAVTPALGNTGKKLGQHIDAVLSGKSFGKEFKKQYGPHSQASELVSMIRQAVNYGN